MTQKPEDKKLEKWLKRLASEPLKPSIEDTVKREDFSDRKYWNLMDEGAEQEDYQEEKKPEPKKYLISGEKYQGPRKKYGMY